MIKVTVNGKAVEVSEGTDLKMFLSSGKADTDRIIVVLNDAVVKNDRWTQTILTEGDRLELVSFVGGG